MVLQQIEAGQHEPSYSADPVRTRLAHIYLRGDGIEFGALHAGLAIPAGARVRYADVAGGEILHHQFPRQMGIRTPDIVTNLECMEEIPPNSLDFVVANHVLEHTENPLKALKAIASRLKRGAIAYLALPDKRFSFDRLRVVTPLAHLIRDEIEGPEWSREEHYQEWVYLVDGQSGAAAQARILHLEEKRENIHFHVWDMAAMQEMFRYVDEREDIELRLVECVANGSEVIWILEKDQGTVPIPKKWPRPSHCLICNQQGIDLYSPEQDGACPVYICFDCGFAFTWPRIPQDFSQCNEEMCFDESFICNAGNNAAWARELDTSVRSLHASWGDEAFGRDGAPTLLDVGCAGGKLLPYFQALGWNVEGVDPWVSAARAGRKYLNVHIAISKLEEAILPSESYDLVLLNDTLQFVADPRAIVELCLQVLRPGALLMIDLPNFHSQEFSAQGTSASMFLPAFHISYFSMDSLQFLLKRSGCEIALSFIYGGENGDDRLRLMARKRGNTSLQELAESDTQP